MSKEEIQKRIKSFREETGITEEDLEDVNSFEFKKYQQFIDNLSSEASALIRLKEMCLNVSNTEKFLSHLDSLQGKEILPEEKESLESIAEILEKQFMGQYDVTNPGDDRFLTLIGGLEKIIVGYEKLGLEKSVLKLKELLTVSREKYLKEYLLVERKGYLMEHNEGFGPAKWHRDMTVENYHINWEEAVNIYRKTTLNPNARKLSGTLRKHLAEAIEIAKSDLESKPSNTESQKNRIPEFLKILENAKNDLA